MGIGILAFVAVVGFFLWVAHLASTGAARELGENVRRKLGGRK